MQTYKNQIYPTADVTGIIVPHNWDENGRVIQIAMYTNKEEVYLVRHNQKAKELLNYINKRAAVKVKILRGNDGNPFIVVKNYIVLAEDVEDENDNT